jgi:hypothetical protein
MNDDEQVELNTFNASLPITVLELRAYRIIGSRILYTVWFLELRQYEIWFTI